MNARTLFLMPVSLALILSAASQIYLEREESLREKQDRADRLQQKLASVQKSAEDSRLSLLKSMGELQLAKDELAHLQQSSNMTPYQFSSAQTKVWAAQMKVDAAQLDQLNHKQAAGEALADLKSIPANQ